MKLTCPFCNFSAEINSSRIPAGGTRATCPHCKQVFPVTPTASDTPVTTCPKCGLKQAQGESCSQCGLIYEKYRAAEERRRLAEIPEPVESVPDTMSLPVSDSPSFSFGYGRGEIMSWVREGRIAADDLPQAASVAGMLPGPVQWHRFLDGLALWLGAIFLAAAVIFFFAYNWQELGHFARFGIAELLLTGAVIASWRLGLERLSGKAALLAATLLVGALLALVGQTYQTGADPWELFATWALFVLPWVAVSCFSPLWLLWLALVNLAIGLYYSVFAGVIGMILGKETLWWTLALVNTAALVVWELAASRGVPWLQDRWSPRIVATAVATFITFLAGWWIVDRDIVGIAEVLGYSAWIFCAYLIYRQRIYDLYILALGTLSLIITITVFLGHNMLQHGEAGAFLFIGLLVLGMSAAGGWWLRNVAREVES